MSTAKYISRGFVSLLVLFGMMSAAPAWAQGRHPPERPEPIPRLLDKSNPQALTAEALPTIGTIYVETFGTDSARCGFRRLPCQTIRYGIYRGQQERPDLLIDQAWFKVQVGPGTYNERLVIMGSWIQIQGAGAGNTIITAGHKSDGSATAVLAYGQGIYLDGLTFSDSDVGVWSIAGGEVLVTNSSFVGNIDAFVVSSSYGYAQYCTFTDNVYAAEALSSSRMHVWDSTITGPGPEVYGEGVVSYTGSSVLLQSTDPNTPVSITNYMYAIDVGNNGFLIMRHGSVTGNAVAMWIGSNSSANVNFSSLSNNSGTVEGEGFPATLVTLDSMLWIRNSEVSSNPNGGIGLNNFSHAVLRNVTLSSNGPGDFIVDDSSDYRNYAPGP